MAKITQFNAQVLDGVIKREVEAALKEVGKEYGLQFRCGGGKFLAQSATLKLEVSVVGEGGVVITKERQAFIKLADEYGLKPTDLDREFTSARRRYRIVGLNNKAVRMPILAQDIETGKTYKFEEDGVRRALFLEDAKAAGSKVIETAAA